jgi:hypothetical protein
VAAGVLWGHPQELSGSQIGTPPLHQPGRSCVPEGMGCHSAGKFGETDRRSEPLLHRRHRLAVEFDEAVRDQLSLFPAPQVH